MSFYPSGMGPARFTVVGVRLCLIGWVGALGLAIPAHAQADALSIPLSEPVERLTAALDPTQHQALSPDTSEASAQARRLSRIRVVRPPVRDGEHQLVSGHSLALQPGADHQHRLAEDL